jgi:hypothetical protein
MPNGAVRKENAQRTRKVKLVLPANERGAIAETETLVNKALGDIPRLERGRAVVVLNDIDAVIRKRASNGNLSENALKAIAFWHKKILNKKEQLEKQGG